jgi:twinkle protein
MKGNGMLDKPRLSVEHANWLEDVRKIGCELATEKGVVSKGENIAFQFRRMDGSIAFMKFRRAMADGAKTFWIEPKGAELCLWNEPCLSEPSEAPLIITEGEFDALAFLEVGATHVVSVPNGAARDKPGEGNIDPSSDAAFRYLWRDNKLRAELMSFDRIVLATDSDPKGNILRDELAIRLGRTRCWFVTYPPGCKDANDVLVEHGPEALRAVVTNARPIVADRLVSFSEIPERADDARYSTGWSKFDQHFMLLFPMLVIVTGQPNHGKSQWTLGVVSNLARLWGLKCAILQFEDNPDRNRRHLVRYATSWVNQQHGGIAGDPVAWVDRMFKTISPSEHLREDQDFDLAWLHDAIEEAATRHACKIVVIDPWNEVEHLWGRQDTEVTYLNRALRRLKLLSRRYQIAILIVTHPTKEALNWTRIEDTSLYHINGGAAWNNKADLGVIVWAADRKAPARDVKVDKSKDWDRMGHPGIVRMTFDPRHATWTCAD